MNIRKKRQHVLQKVCDVINTYPNDSQFTLPGLLKSFKDYYPGVEIHKGTTSVLVSKAVRMGYLKSEKIAKDLQTDGCFVQYIKVLDIPEDEGKLLFKSGKLSSPIEPKKKAPAPTPTLAMMSGEGVEVKVSYKYIKELQSLVISQNYKISTMKKEFSDAKSELSEVLDECANLKTDNKRLIDEKSTLAAEIKQLKEKPFPEVAAVSELDLSEFQDNVK